MKFSAALALAAGVTAMPRRYEPEESGPWADPRRGDCPIETTTCAIARRGEYPDCRTDSSTCAIARRGEYPDSRTESSTCAVARRGEHPIETSTCAIARRGENLDCRTDSSTCAVARSVDTSTHVDRDGKKEDVTKNLQETYQQCLIAVLEDIKNGKAPQPHKSEEPKQQCGCSKGYECPETEVEKECVFEEKPASDDEDQVEEAESDDEADRESENDDESDDEEEAEVEPKPCRIEEECKEEPEPCPLQKECEQKPCSLEEESKKEDKKQPKPCPPKKDCKEKPKPCKLAAQPLVPACEHYAKLGDCVFCDHNNNGIQDANEVCIPKHHPKPCPDSDSDSDDEERKCEKKMAKKPVKGPYNAFREPPFDTKFSTPNWPAFQAPKNYQLPKDFYAPKEYFHPGAPCYGLDDQNMGEFLLKDLVESQMEKKLENQL